jgi:hypothetical protein
VVDERGDPVPIARVAKDAVPEYLPVGPLPPGVVATNAKGELSLDGLPEGELTFEASLPGVGRGKVHRVKVSAGRTTRRVRITIHPQKGGGAGGEAAAGLPIGLGEAGAAAGANGVVVTFVAPGSGAERAGLAAGDLVVRIDSVAPSSVGDAYRRLAGPERHDVLLEVQRGKKTLTVRVARERVR